MTVRKSLSDNELPAVLLVGMDIAMIHIGHIEKPTFCASD
jgi:hypothetical protein